MRYQYDVFNRVIGQSTSLRTTTTSGTSTTPVEAAYVYNAQQRLGQITAGNIRQNATYYTNGTLAALQTGTPNTSGGIATTVKSDAYTYDGADSSLTQHTISVLGNTAYTYSYQYDSKGNITKITRVNAGSSKSINYTYDAANQLVREDNQIAGYSWAMTYDNAGNMLSRKKYSYTTGTLGSVLSTQTFTYGKDGWGDVLTKINSTTVTSDASGNLLSDGTNTYTWKNGRQLATVTRNGATWTNTYDASGMRTQRVNGSTVYAYIYDGGNLNQMTVGSNALIFTYGINGQPMSVKYNGTDYYYVTNSQGDVVGILNGSGTEVVTYTYDAWGNILSTTGTMAGTLGTHNPLRYRGYVYDQETGLYYVSSRYYDPKICRFINADAVDLLGANGDFASYNLFAYCGNNPVSRADSNGHLWANVLIGAAVGAAAGFVGQVLSDVVTSFLNGEVTISNWQTYTGAVVGGAAGGVVLATTLNINAANIVTGAITTGVGQSLEKLTIDDYNKSWAEIGANTIVDGAVSYGLGKIPGIKGATAGRNNWSAIYKSGLTKLKNGSVAKMGAKVVAKGLGSSIVGGFALDGYYGIKQHAYDRVRNLFS